MFVSDRVNALTQSVLSCLAVFKLTIMISRLRQSAHEILIDDSFKDM